MTRATGGARVRWSAGVVAAVLLGAADPAGADDAPGAGGGAPPGADAAVGSEPGAAARTPGDGDDDERKRDDDERKRDDDERKRDDDERKRDGKRKKDDDALGPFTLGGRVFVRAEASSVDDAAWLGRLTLDSARVSLAYAWKQRLRAKVSLEATGGVSVRDAFVELRDGAVEVRAGRFRLPLSAIEQASAWTLPSVDRGAVAAVLENGLALSGRREGAQATWQVGARARVALAVAQSTAINGDDPPRPLADGAGVTAVARVEAEPAAGVEVAVTGGTREVNYVVDVGRYWAGTAELRLDLDRHGVPLRVWADAVAGTGHLAAITGSAPSSTFVAAQAIAGWRFGGARRSRRYVEPFVRGAVLDPSRATPRDGVVDVALGVAAGAWKRWRVQVQATLVDAQAQRPAGLAGAGADVNDEVRATLQLGAAF